MLFHNILFFIAAIGALSGAIGVVTVRNPFYSVLALVFHLISLAALFLLLRAEFVAAPSYTGTMAEAAGTRTAGTMPAPEPGSVPEPVGHGSGGGPPRYEGGW